VSDRITLTLPQDDSYHGVARLVVGGLAARLSFSYEYLEDLQLALDSLLANGAYQAGSDVTIELLVEEDGVEMCVGPVTSALRTDFERQVDESEGVGLGRLLETLAENVEIESRDGAEWLRLAKRNPARGVAAST
jgi:anti-sigma regulatory factor (Ser/Thr protein kinase)